MALSASWSCALLAWVKRSSSSGFGYWKIRPVAPVHVLIIPRKHIASVSTLDPEDLSIVGAIFSTAAKLAQQFGIAESGYRVVVNNGPDAGQSVFHLHYHLLGGRRMAWPPG